MQRSFLFVFFACGCSVKVTRLLKKPHFHFAVMWFFIPNTLKVSVNLDHDITHDVIYCFKKKKNLDLMFESEKL